MKNWFKRIWNDPVGASIIGGLILFLLSSIGAAVVSYFGEERFLDVLKSIANLEIKLWIVVLVVVVCFILKGLVEKYGSYRYNSHTYSNDKAIYDMIVKELSNDGIIYFLRTNNFAGFSFRLSSLDELDDFYHSHLNDPNFEFFHPKLEEMRKKLMADICEFEDLIATKTFPGKYQDTQTVPPEWEIKCPDYFWEVVNKIHNTTSSICDNYDKIIKFGKKVIKLV